MVTEALESAERRMRQSVESLKKELATIRTGRASSTFLENVMVDYYGVLTPLNHLATITAQDTPWLAPLKPPDISKKAR